ncbi:SSI family serine proteinase inhibitor [Kitasatospora viridis]|uniref:Subtilisin inhibitor-like n=1 Tax=Kitasatospora viridis TaxID=281105 RepID=A0A561SEY6_9ACTN|nr:SSI family serine proteinase inhibitor [Kitasatospora viridis]TWF73434.1 subtilisin inhibitor-like [Kitasatospora viridis]
MRTRSVLKAVVGTVAAAALLAGAAPLAAADTPAPDLLLLTVAGTAPNTAAARTATLDCDGATPAGDHPDAAAACADLLGAQGDFSALTPSHTFCPELYLPVTATAVGLWDGQTVTYQQTFTNTCALQRATGRIFAF